MAYQSPFHFIDATIDPADPRAVQRLKRQLLTEFDLNDQQPLTREGVSLSKDEALTLFDNLTPQTWAVHQQIWTNKPLLSFLETGELPTTNWQDTLPDTPENHPLYAFILPDYASCYADALVRAYDVADVAQFQRVLALPMPDAENNASVYYRRLWSRLIQMVREVENWIDELAAPARPPVFRSIKEGISQYEDKTALLSALPAYFKPAIYRVARVLGDLFLQLNETTWLYYRLKRRVIRLMRRLGPEARQLIKVVYQEQTRRTQERGRVGWDFSAARNPSFRYFYVFVFFTLIRLAYTCRSDDVLPTTASPYNSAQTDSLQTAPRSSEVPVAWRNLPKNFIESQLTPFEPAGSTPVRRPATGSHPLEDWLLLKSGREIDTYNEEARLVIQNRSSQDVIGCFYSPGDWFLSSYYVRAGDTTTVTFLHNGQADNYGLRWLAGKKFSRKPYTLPSITPVGFARSVPVTPGVGFYRAPYAFRTTTVDEMSRRQPFQTLDKLFASSLYMARMVRSNREPYTVFRLTDAGRTVAVQVLTVKP